SADCRNERAASEAEVDRPLIFRPNGRSNVARGGDQAPETVWNRDLTADPHRSVGRNARALRAKGRAPDNPRSEPSRDARQRIAGPFACQPSSSSRTLDLPSLRA